MTPTARTVAECRKRGWEAQNVERPPTKYNPRRVDLFGIIDIVVVTHSGIMGIQTTSGDNHASRVTKALAEPRLRAWLAAGATFAVWSWAKRGAAGKRKLWALREQEISLADYDTDSKRKDVAA